ncbi:hypothetical protein O988_01347 [Pseudogymnoascus sp. VKM F-3808]|nr:hypothetical protein O988_01347 [Pseudogymnoascus sp. VKM F-3808]
MGTKCTICVPETSLVALPKQGGDMICILYHGAIYVFDRYYFPFKARECYRNQDAEEITTIWWSGLEEISYFVKEGSDVQTINLKSLDPEIPPNVARVFSPNPWTDAATKDQNGEDPTTNFSGKSRQKLETENDHLHLRIEQATATLARLRQPHRDKIKQLYDGLSYQIENFVQGSFDNFEDDGNHGFETMLSCPIGRYPGVGAIMRTFQLETLEKLKSSLTSEFWQYKRYGLMAIMMRYVYEAILSEPLSIVREEKTRLLEATFQSLTAVEPPKGNLPVPGTQFNHTNHSVLLDRSAMRTSECDIATAIGDEGYASQYKEIKRRHTDDLYNSLQRILSNGHNEQVKDLIRDKIVAPALALVWEVQSASSIWEFRCFEWSDCQPGELIFSWKETEIGNRPENTGSKKAPHICAGRVSRPVLPDNYGDRLFAKRNIEGAVVDTRPCFAYIVMDDTLAAAPTFNSDGMRLGLGDGICYSALISELVIGPSVVVCGIMQNVVSILTLEPRSLWLQGNEYGRVVVLKVRHLTLAALVEVVTEFYLRARCTTEHGVTEEREGWWPTTGQEVGGLHKTDSGTRRGSG